MNFFIFLIVILFGFVFSDDFKEELSKKLAGCETKLNDAIHDAKDHGFDYYVKDFNHYSTRINQIREEIRQFSQNDNSEAGSKLRNSVSNLCERIISTIENPFPKETLKYRALYLAVIKRASNQSTKQNIFEEKQVVDVLKIIEQEDYITSHPLEDIQNELAILQTMYQMLEESLKESTIPSFEDHYKLALRTKKIQEEILKRDHGNDTQIISKIHDDAEMFLQLTASLARLFPINEQLIVEKFLALLDVHYKLQQKLKELKHALPTVKESLLKRLDVLEELLPKNSEVRNNRIAIDQATKPRIAQAREEVLKLDEEIDEVHARKLADQIADLELFVPLRAEFAQPKRGILATALSYAYQHIFELETKNHNDIVQIIQEIIFYEFSLRSISSTAFDKTTIDIAKTNLANKYKEIDHPYPNGSLEDYEALIYRARAVIQVSNNGKPSWYNRFQSFLMKIHELHDHLPLDSGTKVLDWFQIVQGTKSTFDELLRIEELKPKK